MTDVCHFAKKIASDSKQKENGQYVQKSSGNCLFTVGISLYSPSRDIVLLTYTLNLAFQLCFESKLVLICWKTWNLETCTNWYVLAKNVMLWLLFKFKYIGIHIYVQITNVFTSYLWPGVTTGWIGCTINMFHPNSCLCPCSYLMLQWQLLAIAWKAMRPLTRDMKSHYSVSEGGKLSKLLTQLARHCLWLSVAVCHCP